MIHFEPRYVSVIRGPGPAAGAGHHGAGEAGERPGRLPPGRHALPAGLLPGQGSRYLNLLYHNVLFP